MKKELNIKTEQKCWSLVNNITYAEVPFWYGATYKNLKCSICMPKVRGGERYPLLVWLCGALSRSWMWMCGGPSGQSSPEEAASLPLWNTGPVMRRSFLRHSVM